jgi:hypothetical protein
MSKVKPTKISKSHKGRVEIEGQTFSLLYDYDREKLKVLTDGGKIEWFKQRMEFIFINPIHLLWDRQSELYKKINTNEISGIRHRGFNIAIFCTVLSGIESLGVFVKVVTKHNKGNKKNFCEYIEKYMSGWDKKVQINGNQKDLKDLLWKNCRNAIAHGFRITEIAIDYIERDGAEQRWSCINGIFHINCFKFFSDFEKSTISFYGDIRNDLSVRANFIKTFNAFYSEKK